MTPTDYLLAALGGAIVVGIADAARWWLCRPISTYKQRQRARDAARTSKTDAFIPVSLLPPDKD